MIIRRIWIERRVDSHRYDTEVSPPRNETLLRMLMIPPTRNATPTGVAICWAISTNDAGSILSCDPTVTTTCVPIRNQVAERSGRNLLGNHDAHLMPVTKLSDILVILDENRSVDKQATASGGKLRIKKTKLNNQFALSGPTFLAYLETLLYGYVYAQCKTNQRHIGSLCAQYPSTLMRSER